VKIVVRQKSGLGNQLFQYAAGWYYAKRYAAQLRITVDPERDAVSHGFPRPFLLSNFCISAPCSGLTLAERLVVSGNPKWKPAISVLRRVLGAQVLIEQPGQQHSFRQDLSIREDVRVIYLFGYWQVFPIVEEISADLRREFRFRHPASGKNLDMLAQIERCKDSVSLHLRRGDFALAVEGNRALPMSYYRRAIKLFRDRLVDPVFFVFSDDIDYARKNLPGDIKATFVSDNDAWSAHEDLRLMSSCRHHIIANSSFSWWGAWLNPRPDKIVFAPKLWYCKPESYYPDLFPRDWILDDF
jgi:hypothetical protein